MVSCISMLWEKRSSLKQKRGYLYIRETIYERDKRTLKRKAPKLGDGSATKERWKYSKKVDIYCGKIIEDTPLKHLITFRQYVEQIYSQTFLEYKTKIPFSDLLEDFISYILYVHEIDKKEFFEGKKVAYALSSGYLSREGIEFLRRFSLKKNPLISSEIERFANRCLDIGIYDDEIIMLLYMKLLPQEDTKLLEQELSEKFEELEIQSHNSFKDFIKTEHKN